jgi:hypothetical protein
MPSGLRSALTAWVTALGGLAILWVIFEPWSSSVNIAVHLALGAWWLTLASVVGVLFLRVKQTRTIERQSATADFLAGRKLNRFGFNPTDGIFPPRISFRSDAIILGIILVLFFGFVFFLSVGYRSKPLLLNFEIFLAIVGAAIVASGFFADAKNLLEYFSIPMRPSTMWVALSIRAFQILVGLLMLAVCTHVAVSDFLADRETIAGFVDAAEVRYRPFSENEHFVTIDGIRYRALTQLAEKVGSGDRVQAKITKGSKTIVDIGPLGK